VKLFVTATAPTLLAVATYAEHLAAREGLDLEQRSVRTAALDLGPIDAIRQKAIIAEVATMAHDIRFDYAVLPSSCRWQSFALLASDMDSTLITIECIDEIADFCGKKSEVAAITEAAMRGEIADFAESLRRRVALLEGVPERVLERVYEERLQLSPGASELILKARQQGLKTLLVSGGFTYFTSRLRDRLSLDFACSNQLEIVAGHLSGAVTGPILDAEGKRQALLRHCRQLGVDASRAIALGDGANDLPMMAIAGLSIAYHAKPAVRSAADAAISFGGLDILIDWLGPSDVIESS
jgi:phosphoserine phosphatase